MKTDISVFPWANIGQKDHSNPYSTTILSDICRKECCRELLKCLVNLIRRTIISNSGDT